MLKPLNFSQFKQLKKVSLNDMNRWVMSIYQSGYDEGLASKEEQIIELSDDELFQRIMSVPGMTEDLACEIVSVILDSN